ncbi:hypothetical protein [Fusibacter ferrireducens]|uniref:Uncharacterized protein n=1 Tax=Fusibacter ferrireducens TaxID=2785058 RepID=A0ABR9ZNR6_9FIRM|nr:hypothetical protein [Fusibacter ferrireducens]MBF4692102.1 hypothetical protein [Fusibacter ferrireducens]
MIKELAEGYLRGVSGKLIEPDAYSVSDEEVEDFDLKFPYKVRVSKSSFARTLYPMLYRVLVVNDIIG